MNTPDRKLLIDYFSGKLPAADVDSIETYIATSSDVEFIQSCIKEAWLQTPAPAADYLPKAQLEQAWDIFNVQQHRHTQKRIRSLPRWTQIAAACLLTAIASWSAWILLHRQHTKPIAWHTITAAPLSLKKMQLPDGSTITLFPGATLQYNSAYNQEERKIWLKGRAWFEVASASQKPFTVHTGHYTTRVLGTSFEINEQTDHHLQVSLHTGKVQVLQQQTALATLQPAEYIDITTTNGSFRKGTSNTNTLSWLNGELSYDQAPLQTVCDDLRHWYGVNIHISKQTLYNKRFTGNFNKMPLQDVLNILSATVGCKYHIQQQRVDIY